MFMSNRAATNWYCGWGSGVVIFYSLHKFKSKLFLVQYDTPTNLEFYNMCMDLPEKMSFIVLILKKKILPTFNGGWK